MVRRWRLLAISQIPYYPLNAPEVEHGAHFLILYYPLNAR
jgi:hypothetical protein